MQKTSKFIQILILLFLTGTLWLVHVILVFAFEASDNNNNMSYIPENATSVYRLDGQQLTRELIASLLISDDEDLNKIAQDRIPTTLEGKSESIGVSFDSDIILFRMQEDGLSFTGILFNLWDHRNFSRNMPKYLGKNGVSTSTDRVGLVLLADYDSFSKKDLKKKAKKILSKETLFLAKHPTKNSNALVSVWYQEESQAISDVGVDIQNNHILIQGTFETKHDFSATPLAMNEGGFHVHSQWFPEIWSGVIQEYLEEQDISIPPIHQFTLNYFGNFIATEPNVALLPILSGSVEFDSPVSKDSIFQKFPVVLEDSITGTTTYDILTRTYAVKQLNERTLQIRSTESMNLTPKKYSTTAELSGSPKHLLKMDGDAFIRRIMSLSSEYRATGSLVNEISTIDIKMWPATADKYRIQGKVELKDDKWPLNELLKFLIRSKILQ